MGKVHGFSLQWLDSKGEATGEVELCASFGAACSRVRKKHRDVHFVTMVTESRWLAFPNNEALVAVALIVKVEE